MQGEPQQLPGASVLKFATGSVEPGGSVDSSSEEGRGPVDGRTMAVTARKKVVLVPKIIHGERSVSLLKEEKIGGPERGPKEGTWKGGALGGGGSRCGERGSGGWRKQVSEDGEERLGDLDATQHGRSGLSRWNISGEYLYCCQSKGGGLDLTQPRQLPVTRAQYKPRKTRDPNRRTIASATVPVSRNLPLKKNIKKAGTSRDIIGRQNWVERREGQGHGRGTVTGRETGRGRGTGRGTWRERIPSLSHATGKQALPTQF